MFRSIGIITGLSILILLFNNSYGSVSDEYLISKNVGGQNILVSSHKKIINADYAYDLGLTGKDVKIGCVDCGYYDLAANSNVIFNNIMSSDGIDTSGDYYYYFDHPVKVVANINDTKYGIAPQSKVYISCFPYSDTFFHKVGTAIKELVDEGVSFIVLSLGGDIETINYYGHPNTLFPNELKESLFYARDHQVGILMAAGNEESTLGEIIYPDIFHFLKEMQGCLRFVLGETIRDNKEIRFDLSNYVRSNNIFPYCISAPAENILTLNHKGQETIWSGTSAACPIVAGSAALIKEKFPMLSPKEILDAMCKNARKISLEKLNFSFEDFLQKKNFLIKKDEIMNRKNFSRLLIRSLGNLTLEQKEKKILDFKEIEIKRIEDSLRMDYEYSCYLSGRDVGSGVLDIKSTLIFLTLGDLATKK